MAAWGINLFMAALVALSGIGYGLAFREAGPFQPSIGYAWRIGTHPWFMAALAAALLTAFVKPALFNLVGVQRAYMLGPVGYIALLVASALVFKESVTPLNVIGAAVILAGTLLVVR